jgi:hypothetical protein
MDLQNHKLKVESSPLYLMSREPVMSYYALSIKLSCWACFCLCKRKWHIQVFKYIWAPAGNCYRVEKERQKRLAKSKWIWFYSFLFHTELERSGRLTHSFYFQVANLQLKTGYHYIKSITKAYTRLKIPISVSAMSPCWWAQEPWSPLQQTQLCNQLDSIMQINSSIFYSQFRSHHSALI